MSGAGDLQSEWNRPGAKRARLSRAAIVERPYSA